MAASVVVRHLRGVLVREGLDRLADGALLEQFVSQADEAAFAEIVRRHGPLVLSVCRRVLRDPCDVDDAFQATFLVLARKAGAIRKKQAVGSWLYGVAYRLALRLRGQRARREAREASATVEPPASSPDPLEGITARELLDVLDEELARLPEKYRQPLIVCHLQGRTTQDAARLLGQPQNTLKTRLVRGRELLQQRLARRGLALTSAALALMLTRPAEAAVPAPLLRNACRVALDPTLAPARVPALAAGLLRTMVAERLRGWLLALGALGVVALGFALRPAATVEAPPANDEILVATDVAVPFPADPLPPGAIARLGTTRLRHGQVLLALGFEADDRTLVTVTHRLTAHRWDRASGRELGRVRLERPEQCELACSLDLPRNGPFAPHSVALSADGRSLVALTVEGKVLGWDLTTGKLQGRPVEARVRSLAFLPNGDLVSQGDDGAVTRYAAASGEVVRRFRLPPTLAATARPGVNGRLAVSADGRVVAAAVVAAGDMDGVQQAAVAWDVATGRVIHESEAGDEVEDFAPALSADGTQLAWPTATASVVCVELASGRRDHLKKAGEFAQVVFSADGRLLLTRRAGDRTVTAWDAARGQIERQLNAEGQGEGWLTPVGLAAGNPLQVSHDGRWLALPGSSGAVLILDLATGREAHPVLGHQSVLELVRVTPDGRGVLTHGVDGVVRRWGVEQGENRGVLRQGEPEVHVVHAPDYSAFVRHRPGSNTFAIHHADGTEAPHELDAPEGLRFVFSPDARWLAVRGRWDRALYLYDTATGVLKHELRGPRLWSPRMQSVGIAFSPDSTRVGTIGVDGLFRWWRVRDGRELRAFPVSDDPLLEDVTVSPDGRLLAVDLGHSVGLWDLATGQWRGRLGHPAPTRREPPPTQSEVWPQAPQRLSFSPDGRMLARVEDELAIRLWDVQAARPLARLTGHEGEVTSLAFTPDGRRLISASADTTALVWDLGRATAELSPASGLEMLMLPGPGPGIELVLLAGQGREQESRTAPGRNSAPGCQAARPSWPAWSGIRAWGHGWAAGWGAGRWTRPPGIAARPVAAASA